LFRGFSTQYIVLHCLAQLRICLVADEKLAGAVLGAVFAAILAKFIWWPWAYWIMGIVLFTYTATSFLILPPDELDSSSKASFDIAGTITGVVGLILFNFVWNQAGVVGWQAPYTYVLLLIGILFFAAFVYVETHVARHPLVPINMISKEALYALSIIACGWSSFGIWVYFIWQMLLELRHHSALSAAAQGSPCAISGLLASLAVFLLVSRVQVAYIMVTIPLVEIPQPH